MEEAAVLGVAALAELVAGAREGITIVDAGRRFVYANPAACGVLGPLHQLRGQDFIERVPEREREFVLGRFAEQIAGEPASFSGTLIGTDGAERELVWSNTTIEIAGRPHGVAIFRDLTGPRGATRSAVARELHDSVSQALFSMTMHARGAQLSLARAGLDEGGPLSRSLAELVELS
jgi:PAS domain S-box-containing protein